MGDGLARDDQKYAAATDAQSAILQQQQSGGQNNTWWQFPTWLTSTLLTGGLFSPLLVLGWSEPSSRFQISDGFSSGFDSFFNFFSGLSGGTSRSSNNPTQGSSNSPTRSTQGWGNNLMQRAFDYGREHDGSLGGFVFNPALQAQQNRGYIGGRDIYVFEVDRLNQMATTIAPQLEQKSAEINALAAENVQNGYWVGSKSDYERYNVLIGEYNELSAPLIAQQEKVDRVRAEREEEAETTYAGTYGLREGAATLGEDWEKAGTDIASNWVVSPFIGLTRGTVFEGLIPHVNDAAMSLARLPGGTVRMLGGLPSGIEYAVREPVEFVQVFPHEVSGQAAGMVNYATEHPAGFLAPLLLPSIAKGARGLVRATSRVSPGFENMRVYTGRASLGDVFRGDTTFSQYLRREPIRYTPHTTAQMVNDPAIVGNTRSFYHGTSDIFAQTNAIRGSFIVDSGAKSFVERSLFVGPPETGLGRFLPQDGAAFIKITDEARPYSQRIQTLIDQGAPAHIIKPLAYREFFAAPENQILPGVKPTSGWTFQGKLEWEYMIKPGSELFRVENWRTRLFDSLGMKKGTSFTYDPISGKKVEIFEFSFDKPVSRPVNVIFDIPAFQRRLHYSKGYETLAFTGRTAIHGITAPIRFIDERFTEWKIGRKIDKPIDLEAFHAGVYLGRNIKGFKSLIAEDVRLSFLKEVGPDMASPITDLVTGHESVLYGSGIATGQMPKSGWWREFKDVDVFLPRRDLARFLVDAEVMFKRQGIEVKRNGLGLVDAKTGNALLDVHEGPSGYPMIGGKGWLYGEEAPPARPFSWMPEKLLRGEKFLQEFFDTQAQRKLSSLTEQLEKGKFKENRLKDITDSIFTVDYLLDTAEARLQPWQIMKEGKIQKMRDSLVTIKSHPEIKPLYDEALIQAAEYKAGNVNGMVLALEDLPSPITAELLVKGDYTAPKIPNAVSAFEIWAGNRPVIKVGSYDPTAGRSYAGLRATRAGISIGRLSSPLGFDLRSPAGVTVRDLSGAIEGFSPNAISSHLSEVLSSAKGVNSGSGIAALLSGYGFTFGNYDPLSGRSPSPGRYVQDDYSGLYGGSGSYGSYGSSGYGSSLSYSRYGPYPFPSGGYYYFPQIIIPDLITTRKKQKDKKSKRGKKGKRKSGYDYDEFAPVMRPGDFLEFGF